MFRYMRRSKQVLTKEASIEILNRNTSGVLALYGDHAYPYAVPLNYVYSNQRIYFHSAKSGHKIDAMKQHAKVSFCVIDQDEIIQEEYTSYFRSVIVFGQASIVEDEKEKQEALLALAYKYSPDLTMMQHEDTIHKEFDFVSIIALDIEHISGKEAIELVQRKQTK